MQHFRFHFICEEDGIPLPGRITDKGAPLWRHGGNTYIFGTNVIVRQGKKNTEKEAFRRPLSPLIPCLIVNSDLICWFL